MNANIFSTNRQINQIRIILNYTIKSTMHQIHQQPFIISNLFYTYYFLGH